MLGWDDDGDHNDDDHWTVRTSTSKAIITKHLVDPLYPIPKEWYVMIVIMRMICD